MPDEKKTKRFASLLSSDATNYKKVVKDIENNNFDGLHFDVFDGRFVRNFGFNPVIIKSLRKLTELPFNIHLEVEEPELYFNDFIDAGSDIITFHPQANVKSERALRYLKAKKIQTSVAVDLDIKIDKIIQFIPLIDFIIIMSVYPGFGTQEFNDEAGKKIKTLKKIITDNNYNTKIMVDGGIKKEKEEELINYGADILIYGSSLFTKNGKLR